MTAHTLRKRLAFLFFLLAAAAFCTDSGGEAIAVLEAAKKLQAGLMWDPLSGEIEFSLAAHTVQCRIGQPLLFFDRTETRIVSAPYLENGRPVLPLSVFKEIEFFLGQDKTAAAFRVGAILIDPGHGGKDPGTIGSYIDNGTKKEIYEKNIALSASLYLYDMLRNTYPGKKILLTRHDDSFPTLEDRVNMANSVQLRENEAILYVSIHANSAGFNNRPSGFEVWYLPADYRRDLIDKNTASQDILPILNSMLEEEFTTESILIAQNILDGLEQQIGRESRNRGLRAKEWYVVRNAKMPSVLVELGFVSNPDEAKLLDTPAYLQRCALGIYNGLRLFINHFEGS